MRTKLAALVVMSIVGRLPTAMRRRLRAELRQQSRRTCAPPLLKQAWWDTVEARARACELTGDSLEDNRKR
jgi:hypothetical protein